MAALFTLPNVAPNGTIIVGLAAAGEAKPPEGDRIPILDEPSAAAVRAWNWASEKYATHAEAAEYAKFAALVGYYDLSGKYGANRYDGHAADSIGDAKEDNVQDVARFLGGSERQGLLSILVGTKVAFWSTNHHVGQREINTYIRKLIELHYGGAGDLTDDRIAALKDCIWIAGHWVSTKAVLSNLGVQGLDEVPNIGIRFEPTRDITLRMHGTIAGTGRNEIAFAVFAKMAQGMFAELVYAGEDLPRLVGVHLRVRSLDARCHVGSAYLTGHAQYEDLDPPEEVLADASAVAHVLFAGTTLARSPSLIRMELLATNIRFNQMMTIRDALNAQKPSEEKIQEIIASKLAVIERGSADAFLNPIAWLNASTGPGDAPAAVPARGAE
jgi:hypothetical protein